MSGHVTHGITGKPRTGLKGGDCRLEFHARPAGAAYLIEPDGTRWRIYDCVMRRGRLERVYLESANATYRVFVAPDGQQFCHQLGRREACLSATACERQLRNAQAVGSSMRIEIR